MLGAESAATQQRGRKTHPSRARCTMRVAAVPLLLTLAVWKARAMITDPTPEVYTADLPQGICPTAGNYLLPDVTDDTSYYTCCGSKVTTVRKTCRYFVYGEGQFEDLKAAPFNKEMGICMDKETKMNAKSFKAVSATYGNDIAAREMFKFTPQLANEEAEATCMSAAAGRQKPMSSAIASDQEPSSSAALNASITAPSGSGNTSLGVMAPMDSGEWRLITSSKGVSSTGVVAINAVLLPKSDKVLLWARLHMDGSTDNYEPGMISSDGVPEVSTVYDTNTGAYIPKKIRTTPFCTGQAILPDGQILVAGGDGTTKLGYKDGLKGIRLFNTAGDWDKGTWTTLPKELFAPRWYPTQVVMPDGYRVVIVGGTSQQAGLGPIRTAEVYDHRRKASFGETPLRILESGVVKSRTLYPLVYVLPFEPLSPGSVHMFMFSCDKGSIETIKRGYSWAEAVDVHNWPSEGFCGPTSMGGTATMLMLDPKEDYTAEVAMFGGFAQGFRQCVCDTPTSDWAHRIILSKEAVEAKSFEYKREKMPYGRNLNDCVLLPDGKVLIVNGAKSGVVANLRNAALDAWMYDPKAPEGSRFTTLAAGKINRFYHSTALLLPDASVLVLGSEYDECTESCAKKTPFLFQHQAERFLPPYYYSPDRPQIVSLSKSTLKYDGELTVVHLGTVTGAVLMAPAAVSHQVNANQRGVILEVTGRDLDAQSITMKMPPNNYVTQPGYHLLFLMNGDLPCTKASWIRLRP